MGLDETAKKKSQLVQCHVPTQSCYIDTFWINRPYKCIEDIPLDIQRRIMERNKILL